METYDIYEVYYHGKIEDLNLADGVELYYFVRDNGEWDLVSSYAHKTEADKKWYDKWSKMPVTKIDDDDDEFFSATIYVYESTIRDEYNEPLESYDIDGAVYNLEN